MAPSASGIKPGKPAPAGHVTSARKIGRLGNELARQHATHGGQPTRLVANINCEDEGDTSPGGENSCDSAGSLVSSV